MKSDEAWNNLKEKFTSANRIPVERSNITHEEYEAIKDDRALLEEVLARMESALENEFDPNRELEWYVDFLSRAKERLSGVEMVERCDNCEHFKIHCNGAEEGCGNYRAKERLGK
jgi:hypothetical protein